MAEITMPGMLLTGDHASRPAAGDVGKGTLYSCTDHSLVYQTTDGATWDTWATLGGGIPATIFDAAGDLIVASAADTAARLAIGAAGGAVSRINGAVAWNSGTSNPGSAAAGDRYWRTDLGQEIYFDGTRWVTTTLYREPFGIANGMNGITAETSIGRMAPWATTFDLWLDALYTTTYVATTNNGTNFWGLVIQKAAADDTKTTIASFNTSADTVNNWTQRRTAIGASYVAASFREIDLHATPTLSPGAMFWAAAVSYRLIVP